MVELNGPRDDALAGRAWSQPVADVLAATAATAAGLSLAEAASRLARHGANTLPAAPPRSALFRFLAQFDNALIYFLLASAVAAGALGHALDATVILAVVVINAAVGFIQEGKAETALDAIRSLIAPQASVLRGGRRITVGAAEIVPGDIVLLEAGDRVPADVRILRARNLSLDEAALTGESVAAAKGTAPVHAAAPLGDRSCMAYSGTLVASGQGIGVVVATGSATEIGRISTMIRDVDELSTPLLRQFESFARWFALAALLVGAMLAIFAVLVRGYTWAEALMAVVALTVGAIPEGLPAVVTVTLAIGVQRMAARNAVIRRLPAVETIGATSVICTDKTGTLTRNEMTARRIVIAEGTATATGIGYVPEGVLEGPATPAATALLAAAVLCNDAALRHDGAGWRVDGDPMEGALLVLAAKAGLDATAIRQSHRRLDEIPFDAEHRLMATLDVLPDGRRRIHVKGAPERLLTMTRRQLAAGTVSPLDHAYWEARIAAAAGDGERVLAFAFADRTNDTPLDLDTIASDLILLGLVGFLDPPREEAIAAVAECRACGIEVKMITGDHASTAAAIARRIGLSSPQSVLTGADIDALSDDALKSAAVRASVFARTSPAHKLRIVEALQANGAIVAMTGDGINDAPSLKRADVGIAMGAKGTEAAKEAAQVVLLDDNFASIVAAVREGRTVHDNIRKVTAWTLPTNGGEAMTVAVAILAGMTMPMTPAQILWINMLTAITLGLVLAFEPPEPDAMRRPPRDPAAGLLTPFLVWRVCLVSLLFLAGTLLLFQHALARGGNLETARTLVVNGIVAMEIAYLFNVRYLGSASLTATGVRGTRPVVAALVAVTAAQLALTYLPFMNRLFATTPLSLAEGLHVIAIGAAAFAVLEAEKAVMRRLGVAMT